MATTQLADVSKYPNMDNPQDVKDHADTLGWLSGLIIAGTGAALVWVGNKLFGWMWRKFEVYVKRIENAVAQFEAIMELIKKLMKSNDEILENQKQIFERINKIELEQAKIKGKIGLE